jgi:alanine racemase
MQRNWSVNMNMMTIDITDINTVKNEDEVVLIGSQKTWLFQLLLLAVEQSTNYELLTRIAKQSQCKSFNNGFYKII